jgi:hypothetical protein
MRSAFSGKESFSFREKSFPPADYMTNVFPSQAIVRGWGVNPCSGGSEFALIAPDFVWWGIYDGQ